MKRMQEDLSQFDSKLLKLLSANARMSWAELAVGLGVSAPAVTVPVRMTLTLGLVGAGLGGVGAVC